MKADAPDPAQQLEAISIACGREGIRGDSTYGQVAEIIHRLHQAEDLAERYRTQRNELRDAAYAYAEQAMSTARELEQLEATADNRVKWVYRQAVRQGTADKNVDS